MWPVIIAGWLIVGPLWIREQKKINHYAKFYSNTPANPLYDPDLDALFRAPPTSIYDPAIHRAQTDRRNNDVIEEILLKLDYDLEPPTEWWCDGHVILLTDIDRERQFEAVRNMAHINGDYNSVPLRDGGRQLLIRDWHIIRGINPYWAERLADQGVTPTDVDTYGFDPNQGGW